MVGLGKEGMRGENKEINDSQVERSRILKRALLVQKISNYNERTVS